MESVRPRHKPPAPELHKPLQSQSIKAQSQAPDSEHAFRHIQIQPAPPEPYISGAPFMGRRHSAGGYSNAPSSSVDGEPTRVCGTLQMFQIFSLYLGRYILMDCYHHIHNHLQQCDHQKMRFWDNHTIDELSVGRRLSYDPIPCPDKNCMFP